MLTPNFVPKGRKSQDLANEKNAGSLREFSRFITPDGSISNEPPAVGVHCWGEPGPGGYEGGFN